MGHPDYSRAGNCNLSYRSLAAQVLRCPGNARRKAMGDTREKLNDISDLIGKLRADYPAETNAFINFIASFE